MTMTTPKPATTLCAAAAALGLSMYRWDGSSKMADDLMESIEPYNFSEAVDFQTAYLVGYLADKYDVTAEQSVDRANDRVKKSTEDAFASTVQGYASVTTESSNIQLRGGKAQYALYPVWLLNTSWNGNRYTFAMNGQTGQVCGRSAGGQGGGTQMDTGADGPSLVRPPTPSCF